MTLTTGDARTLPANGACHRCQRRITPGRKFCGPCLARRT